jgi:hypothetical protein
MAVPGCVPARSSGAFCFSISVHKVRYKSLDFRLLQTEQFDIYYYDEEKVAADLVGRMAVRW